MQPTSWCLCRPGLRNAGVVGDPGDHCRRVGTRRHDRGTLDHLSSGAVRATEPDHQSADRIVGAAAGFGAPCILGLAAFGPGASSLGVRALGVAVLCAPALGVAVLCAPALGVAALCTPALGVYENSVTE